jgi:hypothetical protein
MTNRMNGTAIRVGEVPSSNLGAPILFVCEDERTEAKIPETAEPRGTLFAGARGCSWDRDRKGPQR